MSAPAPVLEGIRLSLLVYRAELIHDYAAMLREALFSSRAYIRPHDVLRLATLGTDAFLSFLCDLDTGKVLEHGSYLGHMGLESQAVYGTGRLLHRFCTRHIEFAGDHPLSATIDDYLQALLQGFISTREEIILEEQERIRSALQRSLSRYTLQIETAAEIAHAATSSLDLDPLLRTAIELLRTRFDLSYIGIYLLDAGGNGAVLRAETGVASQATPGVGRVVPIDETSALGWCVMHLKPRTTPDSGTVPAAAGPRSELAVPLIVSGQVNGAVTLQSTQMSAFSTQDVVGLQIIANQLANAIQNAHLFTELRRRADELAAANMRLQELDRLKDEFIQNVSHELRTPLTIVSGYVDLLRSNDLGALNPIQQNAVQNIAYSSDALLALVNDIMSILEVEGRPTTPITLSLSNLLRASLANFQGMADEKHITLEADLATVGSPPHVSAEPDQIRRVIDNLLNNALKFTPEHGRVTVTLWHEAHTVFFSVEDTGIGIESHQFERIFERFYQVDGSIRRYFGGTGLGLALSRQIVLLHRGSIAVRSPGLGRGSTFTVALPVT